MTKAARTLQNLFAAAAALWVIDGDSVRLDGQEYRLVGLNTPEIHGQCPQEIASARRARDRLIALKHRARLERVPCAQGATDRYGRACGRLTIDGEDWAAIAIREKLAEPYECTNGHCPRRRDWCKEPLP